MTSPPAIVVRTAHETSAVRGRAARARVSRAVVPLALAAALAGCSGVPGVYTVERAGDGGTAGAPGGGAAAFDADAYVAGIWDAKVLPGLTSEADDAATVTAAVAKDPDAAGAEYGRQAGSGSPWTFVVRGEGKVVAVDTSGPQGLLGVDLAPGDGTPDLFLSVGPAFLGTAVRDALPFVDFSQFTNQIDYADVATALNATVKQKVVADLDPATAEGSTVSFVGAFALVDPKNLVVTPVSLDVTR